MPNPIPPSPRFHRWPRPAPSPRETACELGGFSRREPGRRLCQALLCAVLAGSAAAQPTNVPARPISLQDCFSMALSNNLDLQIERINPQLALYDLGIARAGYDPNFQFSGQHSYSVVGGGLDQNNTVTVASKTDTDSFSSGFSGLGPMGLQYNLSGNVNENRRTGLGSGDTAGGTVGIALTQPLLKNFMIDGTRYNILVARNKLLGADLHLQQQVIAVITAVEQAYYDLVYAKEAVQVQADGLRLAERLYRENKKRVEIGTLPRLDEKQAESEMAARQTDLSSARRDLNTAQNKLKGFLTSYHTLHDVSLEPTEKLLALPRALDLQQSWRTGLAQRPDLRQARLDLERQGITVKYLKNQVLPELDVVGSYGHGASGALVQSFGDAFDEFRAGDMPFWYVGGKLSVPLSNKAARDRYRQGKATAQQLLLGLKKLEESAMMEIDDTVTLIRTSFDSVQSTRQGRLYAEQALDAEQKKLENGTSTSFVVLRLQRDLTAARSAELQALTVYNKALASLWQAEGTTLEQKHISIQPK